MMLGRKPKDIDYSVEASSYQAMREYIASHGEIKIEYPDNFTIVGRIGPGRVCDFVLCRREGPYLDGRHPSWVDVGDIYDDLARRDFTINAMAVNLDDQNTLIDPYNGAKDLENRTLRCVGDAYRKFDEDALRMLRALRFAVTYQMQIDRDIEKCLDRYELTQKLATSVSTNRKREELLKMFAYDTPAALTILAQYPHIYDALFVDTGLWLKPTMEDV